MGQPQKAIEDLDEAVRLDPEFAQAYVNRAVAHIGLGHPRRAIQDFDQAIWLDPKYVRAYYNRGTTYSNLGQPERAIEDFNEAIRLNPNDANIYYTRAVAYGNLVQTRKAIEDYDQAIRLNPRLAEAYSNRGNSYVELGQPQRALEDLDKAIRVDPGNADAYVNRALTHTLLAMDPEAQAEIDRAVELGVDLSNLNRVVEQARRRRSHSPVRRPFEVKHRGARIPWVRQDRSSLPNFFHPTIAQVYLPRATKTRALSRSSWVLTLKKLRYSGSKRAMSFWVTYLTCTWSKNPATFRSPALSPLSMEGRQALE